MPPLGLCRDNGGSPSEFGLEIVITDRGCQKHNFLAPSSKAQTFLEVHVMAQTIVSTKRCYRCKSTKPTGEFHKCKRETDGFQSACKSCRRSIAKEHYHRTPETRSKRIGYSRKYQATDKGRITLKKHDQKRAKSPKVRARSCVRHMVYTGKIPAARELACAKCNNKANEYHHHKGYERPHHVDVIPLCRPCHRKADSQ